MIDVLHGRAVVAGTAAALAIAIPTAILAQVLDEAGPVDDNSSWLLALFVVIIGALGLGGFVAATRRPDAPLANGAAAGVAAYTLVQCVSVIRLVVAGEPATWAAVPFFALLAAAAGMAGGLIADARARRPR